MQTEIVGLYDTRDAAEKTAKSLVDVGLPADEIKVENFEGAIKTPGPATEAQPSLVVVSAEDAGERQAAYGVLAGSGAKTVESVSARVHATKQSTTPKA